MLVLQIAGGIVLAFLAIRFWRVALALALLLLVVGAGFVFYLLVDGGNTTAVTIWNWMLGIGIVFGIILVCAVLSEKLDRWHMANPSRISAALVRFRAAITPAGWKG